MQSDHVEIHTHAQDTPPTSPASADTRILLSSVFGPYAQDDEYGSRKLNPMELYHNQVTRTQGGFSLRMFHRSWGLMLIQSNIEAPCTLLDFPDLNRFIAEIRDKDYDIVGISSIIPNQLKVKKMCALVRQYLPDATIVVGGHVANVADMDRRIDADYIGYINRDPLVHQSVLRRRLVVEEYPRSDVAIYLQRIARKLMESLGPPGASTAPTSSDEGSG